MGQALKEAIDEGIVTREELFITTKLANTHHGPENVERALRNSLANLALEYVDLYLMHTPMGWKFMGDEPENGNPVDANGIPIFSDVDYVDTWKAMESLVDLGLAKSIGVSNFNSLQLKRVIDVARIKPVTNQVECGPTINQEKLRHFCKEHGIILTAYTPLGRMKKVSEEGPQAAVDDPRVKAVAQKYSKTTAQVVLRFLTQLGVAPIPKSSNKERIVENISLFDFELTEEEMKLLESFNKNQRHIPFLLAVTHPHFPFHAEF